MTQIVARGEVVYRCTVCNRKTRVPSNRHGLDKIHYCTITAGCQGKLNRVTIRKDINETPALPPEVPGVQDWFQRVVLYTHEQVIASKTWTIKHDLGSIPIVHTYLNQVVNGVVTAVSTLSPPITVIDENNIVLVFPDAVSGIAQLEALASRDTVSIPTPVIDTTQTFQVSTDVGNITIATLNNDPITDITLVYAIAGQPPLAITYNNIDTTPDANSPWTGISQVYIGGVVYTVRSFNIVTHPAALQSFISGLIPPTGCPIYVQSNNGHRINNVLLLEAQPPFTSVDRIFDRYLDLGAETELSSNILYSYGTIIAKTSAQKSIYPYISVV